MDPRIVPNMMSLRINLLDEINLVVEADHRRLGVTDPRTQCET